MHRLPKIFANSSKHRKAGEDPGSGAGSSSRHQASKPKPRLERLNAIKNCNYDFLPSSGLASSSSSYYSSEESLRTRSLDLYDGRTSFRVDGVRGEIQNICRSLGMSGIDDFGIPIDEYEAMKMRSSSAPATDRKKEVKCLEVVASSGDGGGIGAVDAVCREIEGNDEHVRLAESCDDLISKKCEEGRDLGDIDKNSAEDFASRLVNSSRTSDVKLSDNASGRFDELRANGIKGVRPPVLAPPPSMSLPVVDNDWTTWDIFRAFGPEAHTSASKLERGLCFHEDGGLKRSEDEEHEDRRRRAMGREENHILSGSCSFTTTSYDDDSSSIATDPMSSISPNWKFRRVILEWQKGELLGRGSFGSVYEGISDDGFFFAVKEVSLLDQGDEGKQRIIQLEQEIALLSQFEHENIVQYYGTKKDESHLYIFLELVTKGSLLSLYQKYTLRDSQVSAYTRQILHGLKYLHEKNVVHRDIKCANILVDTNGLVKLADFGLAKATKLNDVNSCKGTAFWMAPEVVRSMGYGLAADIWSLGCTVLEMLTRCFPYVNLECMPALFKIGKGERPDIPDSLSNDARGFILKCLQVNPCLRPTAAQLLDHPFVKQPLPSSSGFTSPPYFARLN